LVALGENSAPTGQELLAEFIQYGNQKPFEEIVRRYAGMVFNVCFRVTKDKHEAEDATQAVFLTLALQARRGADIKALGPWLQQVAKRLSLDTRRSKKRRKTREERHHFEQTVRRESIINDALPSADMDELKTILHEELQKLPAKYRMPLILHYFGGLSRDEMAAELNCKPSTLGVRIFRGREMLAGRLSGRGINISLGALAIAMGYAVKRAVSESLIASTSHAATAMMAGYDASGFASANVIGLTRRATSALAFSKVRVTALTLLMAGSTLGAKAMGILPQINVQQIISNQISRLIRPLLNTPLPRMRVDAQTLPTKSTTPAVASNVGGDSALTQLHPMQRSSPVTKNVGLEMATATSTPSNNSIVVNFADSPMQSVYTKPVTLTSRWVEDSTATTTAFSDKTSSGAVISSAVADPVDTSSGTAGSDSSSMLASLGALSGRVADGLPTRLPLPAASVPNIALTSNDLLVGSASSGWTAPARSGSLNLGSYVATNAVPASQIAVIQIDAVGGTVTETSTGVLSGYGAIKRTGTLWNNGKVVADGDGVDHTLNLTSFTAVATSVSSAQDGLSQSTGSQSIGSQSIASPSAASVSTLSPTLGALAAASGAVPTSTTTYGQSRSAPFTATNSYASASSQTPTPSPNISSGSTANTEGWYAVNHGRLTMDAYTGSNPSVLTWGENPDDDRLGLVNSVRLELSSSAWASGTTAPLDLSLLAPDRDDIPGLSQLDGVPIGLWEVDPAAGALPGADITVCYDAVLASELGASPSSLNLWTLGPDSTWQPVSASSLVLDTQDSLISGYSTDVSYFAVTAIPAEGTDVNQLVAEHLSQVGDQPTPTIQYNAPSGVPEPTTLLPLIAIGAGLLGRRRRAVHACSNHIRSVRA
jgi:RNA polymerase sigma factor (sigma-70 family)